MLRRKTQPREGIESDGKLARERFSDKVTSKKRPGRSEGEAKQLAGRITFQAKGNVG